ncbi:MAG: hypothetical protein ABI760_10895 [Ferruginibacter sp.]
MLKRTCFFLSTLAVIYISSCQKEFTDPDGSLQGPATSKDSTWLSKVFYIDTTAAPDDTTRTILFIYDNLHRVITQTISTHELSYSEIRYSYNSNDTMPFKSVLYSYDPDPFFNDTIYIFHYYDLSGKKLRDSTIYYASSSNTLTDVGNYSWLPGKITGIAYQTSALYPGLYYIYTDTALLDANGNIILLKEYRHDDASGQNDLIFTISSSLDNRPNPFAKLSAFAGRKIFPAGDDPLEFIVSYPQVNNFTSNIIDHYSNGVIDFSETLSLQYVYYSNGSVKEMRPTGFPGKVSFIYTAF